MTPRVISQLVNGFVAVMLLSACAVGEQDRKQPAIVAAKPVVIAAPQEEPIIPKLKPKTQKKAPASPRLSEPEPADTPAAANGTTVPDNHQQLIEQQAPGMPAPTTEAVPPTVGTADPSDGSDPANMSDGAVAAAVPSAPAVIQSEPEPVSKLVSPDELKSKAESEVVTLLGRPVTTRSEGTGTVWTYRAGTCSLDVYFFLDVADNQRRALSYEMLPAGAEYDVTQSCYKALKEAHHVQ
nr:hypothetical protein [uncultured Dongia sp.]